MEYKVILLPRAEKQLRKIKERELLIAIRQSLQEISINPYQNSKVGSLKGIFGHGFYYQGTQYRIAYSIDKKEQVIYIIGLGSHERFWEEIKRYFD